MTSYGVTSTGFVKKTLDDIKAELEASLRDTFGEGVNLLADSLLGNLVGVMSDREAEIWDLAEAVYGSQYPASASEQSLDNVSSITGADRLDATSTTVDVQCTGTPTTSLAAGRVVTNEAGVRFASAAAATIAAATAWAGATGYSVGDIVTNDNNIYVCTVGGTSAGAGGPTGTGDGIADGTCEWNFVGDGTGNVLVEFAAEDTGPIECVTGAIDTEDGKGAIQTPVSGWEDARNLVDGVPGTNQETDAAFRLRRRSLLSSTGNAFLDALIDKLSLVDDVINVFGFENTTDRVDGDGLPAHSFEMLVRGGTDQDIIDKIWETKATGIEPHGTTAGTATDRKGFTHTVKFTRPVEVPVHTIVELTKDDDYPADGDAQVKAAVKAHGDALGIGADVIQSAMYEAIFEVAGVVDVTKLWISKTDPPTGGANIVIDKREISTWNTADVDVTSS